MIVAIRVLACVLALGLSAGVVGNAYALERAEPQLYVLQLIDQGGVSLPLVAPVPNKALSDAGLSTRPTKAFEALRARSSKAYGATSLRLDSATKATLIIDRVADADQVIAEVFWTLAAQGFNELTAEQSAENAARQQELQRQLSLRGQPLNEITGLMSGSQIQLPQFQNFSGQQVQAAPIFAAAQAQAQNNQQNYGVAQSGRNAMISGLYGLAGTGAKAAMGMPGGQTPYPIPGWT